MNTNLKKTLVTGAIALAVLGSAITANELFNQTPTQVSSQSNATSNDKINYSFEEGTNYTILDVEKLKPLYKNLGMNENSSYEFFSYSCIHCYNLEAYIQDLIVGINDFHHIQLGFPNFPIAQTHYILENTLSVKPELYQRARIDLYKTMLFQDLSFEQKVEFLKNYPHARAISDEEVLALSKEADDYSKASRDLAIEIDLEGTPTLVINGKYKLNSESIKSGQEFKALIDYVRKLDSTEQPKSE